jgi:hypothetical protein
MMKKSRQKKAQRIIILSSKRMASKLFNKQFSNDQFIDEDWCERVRMLYEQRYKLPDRLLRAYDLASLVR